MQSKSKPIKIDIRYSLVFETERIFNLIQKSDWYANYKYKLYLPNFLQKNALKQFKNFSKTTIRTNIIKEYKPEQYKKIAKIIEQRWESVSPNVANKFLDSKLKLKPKYILHLTRYGTNGSYGLPNVIVINFREKSITRILSIIIHEIIHLSIENLVIKHKLTHLQKEKVVDLIFQSILPNFYINQQFPAIKSNKINKILKQFPCISTIP